MKVLFKTAKLAKKKGYEIDCDMISYDTYYNKDGKTERSCIMYIGGQYKTDNRWIAPNQSELQKWLREVYKIDITVALVGADYGFYIHHKRKTTNEGESYGVSGYTYEEALEKGLQEALKLI